MTIPESITVKETSFPIEGDKTIGIQVTSLKESYIIWVGLVTPGQVQSSTGEPGQPVKGEFGPLAVALESKFDPMPIGSTLLGQTIENTSELIAKRLVSKFKKQVFLSFAFKSTDQLLLGTIERKLFEFVQQVDQSS